MPQRTTTQPYLAFASPAPDPEVEPADAVAPAAEEAEPEPSEPVVEIVRVAPDQEPLEGSGNDARDSPTLDVADAEPPATKSHAAPGDTGSLEVEDPNEAQPPIAVVRPRVTTGRVRRLSQRGLPAVTPVQQGRAGPGHLILIVVGICTAVATFFILVGSV